MEPIFYVENDDNDVFLLRRAFAKMGITNAIRHFPSGETFKKGVLASPDIPKLHLFDLKLDAESGLDLLRWVKAQERLAAVPVVIFSSGAIPDEMIESMTLDASAYMFKPSGIETWQEVAEQLALAAGLIPHIPELRTKE
jgi:DNA-binding NtrC family response regulator